MKKNATNRLKFYADTPRGEKNKLFIYNVSHYEHAIDLVAKFVQKYGFTIRAAYYENQNHLSIRFDNKYDLSTWTNSIEEEENRKRLLKELANKYQNLPVNHQ